jgi:hypothetical protein
MRLSARPRHAQTSTQWVIVAGEEGDGIQTGGRLAGFPGPLAKEVFTPRIRAKSKDAVDSTSLEPKTPRITVRPLGPATSHNPAPLRSRLGPARSSDSHECHLLQRVASSKGAVDFRGRSVRGSVAAR